MGRPLRIEFAGALYHVTSRGDGREDIYLDDGDREQFLGVLAQACDRYRWVCHAYCLMSNHYHLVVETVEANLAKGMGYLNGFYTRRFNRRRKRVGHVFQGRYKAILVDKDSYLLELSRYVVLNPVRAGMVRAAGQWSWSSYRATIGRAPRPRWLETDTVLGQLGSGRADAVQRYIRFVAEGRTRPVWNQLRQQLYLGDAQFVEKMQRHVQPAQDLEEIPRVQHRPAAGTLEFYERQCSCRDQAMAEAYASGGYTLKAIADHFGVHYSTVSRAVRKWELKH